MKNIICIVLVSMVILACNSNDDNTAMKDIESTLIAKELLNGSEGITQQNMVITDQATWNDLITHMNSINTETDNFSETDIDFSEYTVIALIDEVRSTGGYSLELDITSNSESIMVNVTHTVDISSEGYATTVINQPYHIVKIPSSDLPILFE